MRYPRWETSTSPPDLLDSVVHVWRVSLQASDAEYASLVDLLQADERSRAARYLSDRVRRRFVIGRARLRCLLGDYLGTSPAAVALSYSRLGKPFVSQAGQPHTLHFNFSNSSDLALAAFTRDHELGVDVERLREITSLEGLVRRFFAAGEIEQVLNLRDPDRRRAAFFRCWTRKEAYLKAVGKGLTFPVNQVCVTVGDEQPARVVWLRGDKAAAAQWQLESLVPDEGSIGAVALPTADAPCRIECYHWG